MDVLTPCVGRDDTLERLSRLVEANRWVTLTGAPGCGQTLVARHLAASKVGTPAVLFELLRSSSIGGVVEGKLAGPELRMGLARAGVDPAVAPVFEAMEDASKRDVVDRALRVRAAFAVQER